MQLDDIIEIGPVVYAAPVDGNNLGAVYNVTNGMLWRYTWLKHQSIYQRDGSKMTHQDYEALDMYALVSQAEMWHNDIQAGVED